MEITVDHEAHEYVTEVVRQCNGECGGLGYVDLIKPGEFYITEFVLLPQDAGNWHVDFEGKDYIEEITRAASAERENELRVSWHSHHDMDSYFSTRDDNGVLEYSQTGIPWLISLVFNKAGDVASRVDIFDHEVCDQITIRDLEYNVDIPSTELSERVAEELKAKIKEKPKNNWNKQSSNKGNSNKQEPVYPGWSDDDDDAPFTFAGLGYEMDRQAWKDEDYENVAQEIISGASLTDGFDDLALTMGFDPTSLSEEERSDLLELMNDDKSKS